MCRRNQILFITTKLNIKNICGYFWRLSIYNIRKRKNIDLMSSEAWRIVFFVTIVLENIGNRSYLVCV